MAAFLDVCRFTPTAGGTTDWTVSAAVTGYQTPANAGAVNATVYRYRAESADLSQWEIGYGAYTSAGTILARTTVLFNSSGTTSKINFTATPQVAVVALKEDLLSIEEANSFTTTQQSQARSNLAAAGVVRVQKFIASGTYTPSTGMLYCIIECIGGGGGGAGATGNAGGINLGAGGGAGGYSRTYSSAATIGASKAVTIGAAGTAGAAANGNGGAGGATSVGTLCVASGGGGGGGGNTTGVGGVGATAGTGDIAAPGAPGGASIFSTVNSTNYSSDAGGSTPFGSGGGSQNATANAAGLAASGFGSGGSGAVTNGTASSFAGGAGASGIVIITEYCTQ